MNVLMDEKVKHRLVGVAVLVALVLIVALLIAKNANHPVKARPAFGENVPPANQSFIAKAAVIKMTQPLVQIMHEEKLSYKAKPAVIAAKEEINKVKIISKKTIAHITPVPKPVVLKNFYAVQLATFSAEANATSLIKKLKAAGHKASVSRTLLHDKYVYKVVVGQNLQKAEATRLKNLLAQTTQINGFVIPIKVG